MSAVAQWHHHGVWGKGVCVQGVGNCRSGSAGGQGVRLGPGWDHRGRRKGNSGLLRSACGTPSLSLHAWSTRSSRAGPEGTGASAQGMRFQGRDVGC